MEKENQLQTVKKDNVFQGEDSYKRAMEVATTIASSDLVPATYYKKPANCLIALDVARQVNTSPLIVMQNLHIIKGKPSWSSTYIAGAIRTKYRNVKVILNGEGMDRGCHVVAYDNNGVAIAEGVRVTMAMAKAEGWISKTGSKWQTMPDLMLQYRANAFFGRVHCPEILIGFQSEFEIYDVTAKETDVQVEDPFPTEKPVETEPKVAPEIVEPEAKPQESTASLIAKTKLEIEGYLVNKGEPSTAIFKYSNKVFPGKSMETLTLAEMNQLKTFVIDGVI